MSKPPRWAGDVVAQRLPSMCWVLASNPITTNTQSCQAMALGYGSSNGLTCTDLRRCALGTLRVIRDSFPLASLGILPTVLFSLISTGKLETLFWENLP